MEVKHEGKTQTADRFILLKDVTTDRPEDEKGMFLKCWLNIWKQCEHKEASSSRPPAQSGHWAPTQKLLQVKHESRGGGAEKKLRVCWRENSGGHELPAVVFSATLLRELSAK